MNRQEGGSPVERAQPREPVGVRELERRVDGVLVFEQPDWALRFPWLTQGITARASGLDLKPLRTPAGVCADDDRAAWERLRVATGFGRLVRCRQVHGPEVAISSTEDAGASEADALVTEGPDLLLAITVADCIPVFFVDERTRLLGLAHAGWRGIVAGIIEETLGTMSALGASRRELHVHLGPAICGSCYEVGSEVAEALEIASDEGCVDLRTVAARRLVSEGVDANRVTSSDWCTRCGTRRPFYSYRGGDQNARMAAFLGRRAG